MTIWIHLGAHKTASSLLQHTLRMNAAKLERNGVVQVASTSREYTDGFLPVYNESIAAFYKRGKLGEDPAFEMAEQRFHDLIRHGAGRDVVISDERLLTGRIGFTKTLYPNAKVIAEWFGRVLDGSDVRFILYIRRQDHFVESCYLQLVQEGQTLSFEDFLETIDLSALRWNEVVDPFAAAFGPSRVTVRPFELIRRSTEAFIRDFFEIFAKGVEIDIDRLVMNESFSAKALEIAHAVFPLLDSDERKRMRRFLQEAFSGPEYPRATLFGEDRRLETLGRYTESNLEVFRCYLPELDPVDLGYAGEQGLSAVRETAEVRGGGGFDAAIAEGARLYDEGDYRGAETRFRGAIEIDANRFIAYQKLGEALVRQGRSAAALESFRRSAELKPGYFRCHFSMASILAEQGKRDGAIDLLRKTVSLNPEFHGAWHLLGLLLAQTPALSEAADCLRKAVQLEPEFVRGYTALGRTLARLGRTGEAVECHQTVSELRGWTECRTKGYEFVLEGWFATHIPVWEEQLRDCAGRKDLRAVEVGSFEGMSCCWLVDHVLTHPSAEIVCIDPDFQPLFDVNIRRSGASQKVRKIESRSQDALPELEADSYHLVFVDGEHLAPSVFLDAVYGLRLLRIGGLMIFDDYLKPPERDLRQPVKLGVDHFLSIYGGCVELLHSGYQVFLRKTGPPPADLPERMASSVDRIFDQAPRKLRTEVERRKVAMLGSGGDKDQLLQGLRAIIELDPEFPWIAEAPLPG
jgi:tetratricopeptide (TPR) repeat protein